MKNIILIIPDSIKEELIEEISKNYNLLNITFYSRQEFINKVSYKYTSRSIYYLMNKYNIKYEIAKIYLDNLIYIDNTEYESNKINKLVNIRNELIENNLLTLDNLFINYLDTAYIYVYNFDYIDKLFNNILNKFNNVNIINKEYKKYNIDNIYKFNNIEDEVEFVANSICKLINKNIDINNIKLVITSEYNTYITKIFKYYNIPVNINKTCIYNTYLGKYFIDNLDKDLDIVLDNIKNKDNNIYSKIINILNEYTWIDNYNDIKDMLIYDFKHKYIVNNLVNAVNITTLKDNNIKDKDYVYVLGFNQGLIPSIYKDEDYITDNLCKYVSKETSKELNIKEKEIVLNNLYNIKNLTISYKLKSNKDTFYISNLQDIINANIIDSLEEEYNYSNTMNKIKLSKKLDNLIKYGIRDKNIDLLYSNYNINYNSFNNKYTKIDKDNYYKFINNKLLLSYSSLDNYNRCSFRYYLANILKISIYEETFMTNIGTIFHEVLSNMYKEDFNLDIEYQKSIDKINKEFSVKEKFFLNKLKKELYFIIKTIRKQCELSELNNYLLEEKIYKNIEGNIDITFMGIVDKIMYKKYDNRTIVAIIDYKTGNPNININNCIYGLDMQLPIYIYLAKNTNKLENVEIAGFYLQKILNNEINKDYKHSYIKLKEDNLKLAGYSNDNIDIISRFDTSYNDSAMIKSLKTSSKGFYSYSKVIDTDKINKINNIIDNKIKENSKNIEEANFDINPKKQDNKLLGCEFCKFSDICFRKEEDIVEIDIVNEI